MSASTSTAPPTASIGWCPSTSAPSTRRASSHRLRSRKKKPWGRCPSPKRRSAICYVCSAWTRIDSPTLRPCQHRELRRRGARLSRFCRRRGLSSSGGACGLMDRVAASSKQLSACGQRAVPAQPRLGRGWARPAWSWEIRRSDGTSPLRWAGDGAMLGQEATAGSFPAQEGDE